MQNQSFPVTLTKDGSWALLIKSAVELTTLAQPFCVNQAVGDLPRHFHFMAEYSKLDMVKTMGTRAKIKAIWWNIKINLQKLADICGYVLPTNLQNFTQKDLTKVKIFQNVSGGYFFETPCTQYFHHVWSSYVMLFLCTKSRPSRIIVVTIILFLLVVCPPSSKMSCCTLWVRISFPSQLWKEKN